MSDEQAPVWAQAMEARAEARADAMEHRLEAMEHRLIVEVSKAITESEARINRRLDEIRDDIGVNMARADLAHTKIDVDRAEVASLRKEMVGLYRRLQDVEHRLFTGGPKPPETA